MDQTVIKVRAELALGERHIHDKDPNHIHSGRFAEVISIEKASKRIWPTQENASEGAWLGRSARSTR